MAQPALYSCRPILSAPLRWRVELAAQCLVLAVIALFVPWHPPFGFLVLLPILTLGVMLYPYIHGADQSVLATTKPRLNGAIGLLCLVGMLTLGIYQLQSEDHSMSLSFFLFQQGLLVAIVSRIWDRKRDRKGTAAQPE